MTSTSLYRYQVTFPFTRAATKILLHELREEARQRWAANAKHHGFKQDGPIETCYSPGVPNDHGHRRRDYPRRDHRSRQTTTTQRRR